MIYSRNGHCTSRHGDTCCLVLQDRATHWLQAHACVTKSADDTKRALQRFFGPKSKPKHIYTDNSHEFNKSMSDLGYLADTCTPHKPQTNGIAERAVRRVKEGASCALVQSGFSQMWSREALACFCYLYNITDRQLNGITPYQSRFETPFHGPIIPFGAEVQYKPSTPSDIARLQKFGSKTLSGIFMGYALHAGVFGMVIYS